jgi:hypothetical protein
MAIKASSTSQNGFEAKELNVTFGAFKRYRRISFGGWFFEIARRLLNLTKHIENSAIIIADCNHSFNTAVTPPPPARQG